MTKHIPVLCILRQHATEQLRGVLTSLQFGHLIFDIDLPLGFWNLTFNAAQQKFCARFERKFAYKVLMSQIGEVDQITQTEQIDQTNPNNGG
jgi:hypothetical protein